MNRDPIELLDAGWNYAKRGAPWHRQHVDAILPDGQETVAWLEGASPVWSSPADPVWWRKHVPACPMKVTAEGRECFYSELTWNGEAWEGVREDDVVLQWWAFPDNDPTWRLAKDTIFPAGMRVEVLRHGSGASDVDELTEARLMTWKKFGDQVSWCRYRPELSQPPLACTCCSKPSEKFTWLRGTVIQCEECYQNGWRKEGRDCPAWALCEVKLSDGQTDHAYRFNGVQWITTDLRHPWVAWWRNPVVPPSDQIERLARRLCRA
jgi:hypothetical protein